LLIKLYEEMHTWAIDHKDEKGTTSFGLDKFKGKKIVPNCDTKEILII